MNVKELSDLELGKLLAQQQGLLAQTSKNVEILAAEMEKRLAEVKKVQDEKAAESNS